MKYINSFKIFESKNVKNLKVYHATDDKFDTFSLDHAWDGSSK